MRLLRSDSLEVAQCLRSHDSVVARRPLFELQMGVSINLLVISVLVALWSTGRPSAACLGSALLLIWDVILVYRSIFSRRYWIVAATSDRLYIRLFAPYTSQQDAGSDSDVILLDADEITSIAIRTIEVFCLGPKPRVVEWLVVEPSALTRTLVADLFEKLAPPAEGCDLYRNWFAGWVDGVLFTEWQLYQPALQPFAYQIRSRFPHLSMAEPRRSELDLIGFARKPRAEQRQLLRQARLLNLYAACRFAVMFDKYRRRSSTEAREYISQIDAPEK